jgi:hypothetical protein
MKKIALGLLVVLMLAGPALAAPARPKPAKAKIGGTVAPRAATGYRMNAASKRGAALPSERTRTQSKRLSNIGSELSAGSSQAPQPSGDKPFAAGAPAVNPFAPPGSSPGSLWSPPVPLASGINPFQPIASSVNPFQGAGSTAEPLAPSGAGFALPAATNNPAVGGKAVPVTQKVNRSPNPLHSLWSGPLPGKASSANSSSANPFRPPTTP